MITPEKLIPRFSSPSLKLPGLIGTIVLEYVANDLGYLSEYEVEFRVRSTYHPQFNITDYYLLSRNNNECMITVFNNSNDFEGLIEYLNEKPYEAFLRLKDYGLIK